MEPLQRDDEFVSPTAEHNEEGDHEDSGMYARVDATRTSSSRRASQFGIADDTRRQLDALNDMSSADLTGGYQDTNIIPDDDIMLRTRNITEEISVRVPMTPGLSGVR